MKSLVNMNQEQLHIATIERVERPAIAAIPCVLCHTLVPSESSLLRYEKIESVS